MVEIAVKLACAFVVFGSLALLIAVLVMPSAETKDDADD